MDFPCHPAVRNTDYPANHVRSTRMNMLGSSADLISVIFWAVQEEMRHLKPIKSGFEFQQIKTWDERLMEDALRMEQYKVYLEAWKPNEEFHIHQNLRAFYSYSFFISFNL